MSENNIVEELKVLQRKADKYDELSAGREEFVIAVGNIVATENNLPILEANRLPNTIGTSGATK